MCPCTHSRTPVGLNIMLNRAHVNTGLPMLSMFASLLKLKVPESMPEDIKSYTLKIILQNNEINISQLFWFAFKERGREEESNGEKDSD